MKKGNEEGWNGRIEVGRKRGRVGRKERGKE
jgi:hypothetical protein